MIGRAAAARARRWPESHRRSWLVAGMMFVCCMLAARGQPPRAGSRFRFDLPGGEATVMLPEFARQAGVQMIFPARALRGIRTNPLHGDRSVDEALDELLAGTGLVPLYDPATQTYGIKRAPPRAVPAPPPRVSPRRTARGPELPVQLPPVDVRRARDFGVATQTVLPVDRAAPLYFHVVTREEIEQSGATNMAEFLQTVPGYSGEGAESLRSTADLRFLGDANVYIGSFLKLRGWDSQHTAVLINGRRLPPSPESNGPDLSRVPLAAVERIEVLPFAGSALYGDGAVGGAMNVVLRKDVVGSQLSVELDGATRGGGGQALATWLQGWRSADGRTRLTAIGSVERRDGLRLGQRPFLARASSRYPAASLLETDGFGPPLQPLLRAELAGYPAVFASSAAAVGLGIPSRPDAPFALVPQGVNGSDLLATSLPIATEPQQLLSRRQDRVLLLAPSDAYYVLVQAERARADDQLEVYGELGYNRAVQRFSAPDSIDPLPLSLTDPRNPFRRGNAANSGRSASYYFDPLDLPDARFAQTRDGLRAVLGVRGTPTHLWHWSVDNFLDFSHTHSDVASYGASLNDLIRAWTPQNESALAAMYDPLADHVANPVSPDIRDRYLARRSRLRYQSTMLGTEVRVGGLLGRTPAGPLRLELGAEHEWRDRTTRQSATASRDFYAALDNLPTYTAFTAPRENFGRGHRLGALAEAVVPLVRDHRPAKALYNAELNLASRVARLDHGSPVASNLVALKIAPNPSVAFRATYSQGQVTPANSVVNAPLVESTSVVSMVDPARGNVAQTYPVQLVQGGSGELAAEQSRARVLGVILTPEAIPGLFLTIDSWSIRMGNRLRTPSPQELVSYSAYFPGRVERNYPLAWEQALGWAGPVTRLDLRPIHVTRLEADGYDIAGRYRMPATRWGQFTLSGQVETVYRYSEQLLPVTQPVDKVNVVAGAASSGLMDSAVLSPRARATLAWQRRRWFASVTASYAPRYHTDTTTATAALPTATGADGDYIGSSSRWDLQLGYRTAATSRWFADTTWTLGARNVFDRAPPPRADGTSFYSRFDDPRMRTVYVRVEWRH